MTEQTATGGTPVVTEKSPVTPVEKIETPPVESFDEAKAKALIEKLRVEEKEGKKAKSRLAELEAEEQKRQDAAKTELQKAQDRAEKAEAKARAAELSVLRRDVAAKTGLPAALVDRLKGETEEELEADAKDLLAALPAKGAPQLNPTNPGQPQTGETAAEKKARLGL